MTYHARTQQHVLFLFLLITLTSTVFLTYSLFFSVFIVIAIFIRFRLRIDEKVQFKISVFNFSIYKKSVQPNDINQMKFKRIGWAQKCVVIKSKGIPIRIANFYPEKVYEDLANYATNNNISLSKTKDFEILTRKKENHGNL